MILGPIYNWGTPYIPFDWPLVDVLNNSTGLYSITHYTLLLFQESDSIAPSALLQKWKEQALEISLELTERVPSHLDVLTHSRRDEMYNIGQMNDKKL